MAEIDLTAGGWVHDKPLAPLDQLSIRERNVALCVQDLREHGPSTLSQASARTTLSRPTVESVFGHLATIGLVVETELDSHQSGRPAKRYKFDATAGYMAGIDLGVHAARMVVCDLAGTIVESVEVRSSVEVGGPLTEVISQVQQLVAAIEPAHRNIVTAGIGVTGLVGDNQILYSQRRPDWVGIDIVGAVSEVLGCPAVLENDMNLAAVAEHRSGNARGAVDVICVFVGHRVSAGLIMDGQLRRGRHNAAGETSTSTFHLNVDEQGEIIWRDQRSTEEVFQLADQGNTEAAAEIEAFIDGLAEGISILSLAIDPDIVVLGGGVSRAGNQLLVPLRERVALHMSIPTVPELALSSLDRTAVALGALVRGFESTSSSAFGIDGLSAPQIDATCLNLPSKNRLESKEYA
ncbi:ROK family protein [Arthrobacter sp. GMC3]|uniref:ROK family protein n=1 Tax=Arthrobacter sp. GMC3 TaxID=2058894 RepID=UPI0011B09672|nr:ROK family protein [Arthrobacter sp. GMC3]